MPRLAVMNMAVGFLCMFLAASGGAFIATSMSKSYLSDPSQLESWQHMLMESAHGHFNLFGVTHILLGLTMPYSLLSRRVKLLQSIGLGLGTFAMGPGLLARGYLGPQRGTDPIEILLGVCLSCALLCLASHAYGLFAKGLRREC